MSSVLRKKIEAGAGIPPSILKFQDFWDSLQTKVSAWLFDTFEVETRAVPSDRRAVPGNLAASQLDGLLSFVFKEKISPGLCAVAIDEPGATMNAGLRLQQDSASMEGVSELFRKLLLETPAAQLWRSVASGMEGHMAAGLQAPCSDYTVAAGGFDPAQRYLMVGFKFTRNEQPAQVWLVFHFDYVQRHALEFQAKAASRPAGTGQGSVSLRASVKSSTITLNGVLDRLSLTIGECSRLEVGQVLSLPDVNTARVSLQAETVNGTIDIGHCEMGVWKRQRALKLTTPILEPFTRELAKL
ncbi:MAG: FliM/FliN family flagellar motor C-terminal domain-containing protein [Hyphomonas sp.]